MGAAVVEAKRIQGFSRSFRMHFHEEYSIALVREGRSRAEIPSGTEPVSAGNLVLIPEGVPHACNPDVLGSWSYLLLLVDPRWIRGFSEDPEIRAFLFSGEMRTFPAPPDAYEAVDEAARAAALSDGAVRKEAEDRLAAMILSSADKIGNSFRGRDTTIGVRRRSRDPRASRMEAFLRKRYDLRVTLFDLAAVAGVCERSALRIFHSQYGLPPYAYLTNLRVNEAKRLLRAGTVPCAAAQAAGFYDQSHLNRLFLRHVGLTPAAYAAHFREHVRIVQDGRRGIG